MGLRGVGPLQGLTLNKEVTQLQIKALLTTSDSALADIVTNTADAVTELQAQSVLLGAVNETAPGTDTASSGLNGRLQRIAQRLTSLIGLLPSALGQTTMANSLAVVIASDQSAVPISGSVTATVSGVATEAKQDSQITLLGAVNETAPGTDTASSGLNGRLQRIAQRLTSILTAQSDGTQKTQIVDGGGDVADIIQLSNVPVAGDKGLLTQSIIHGLSSAGGGTYIDVKVNPAGKLLVINEIDQTTPGTTNGVVVNSSALPTGAATAARQDTGNASLSSIDTKVGTSNTWLADIDGYISASLDIALSTVDTSINSLLKPASTLSAVTTVGSITNVVHVDDNGGSLTVDGTVAATQSGTWSVRAQDGSGNALTSKSLGAERALSIAVVDGSGNQITSFGGGTQYTEDDASAANPVGNALLARRRDTLSTETTTDGDVTALNSTGKGELYVKHVDAIPITDNGGSLTVDGTVAATQSGTWILGANSGVDIGDVTINNGAGASAVNIQDGGNSITVDGTVAATQSGTWNINNVSGTVSLPTGAATSAYQASTETLIGGVTEAAPGTDTASSGLNGRLQRIAQRLTSLIALLPASLGQKTMANSLAVVVASDQSAIPASQSGTWNITNVSGTVSLPTGAATSAYQASTETLIGGVTEAAPGTDTASSGLNGRLQRVAQRLTSLIALVPASLGQKTMANSFAVAIASDQSSLTVTAGGKTAVNKVRNDYTSTSVTTAAYTQLISAAAFTTACTEVEIFDSSGQTLLLATGGAGAESDKVYIFPGGNGRIPLAIAASTRISVKAVSATASVGELTINFYG